MDHSRTTFFYDGDTLDTLGSGPHTPAPRAGLPTPRETWRVIAGRYALLEKLGRGGFGHVWRALDGLERRHVAVKLIPSLLPRQQAMVRHELTALRWLRLPGVVRLLDEGQDEDQTFIVMEQVPGVPFPGLPTPARWAEVEPAVVRLLEILAQVHRAGVVHLDLKPGNVLVHEGEPTLLDFGVSRGQALARTFKEGSVAGTPRYAAPEQLQGRPDARSDLYALGVMLYEVLTGAPPHDDRVYEALVKARLGQPPPALEPSAGVPPEAARLVNALLVRDPDRRPQDALEALKILGVRSSLELAPALDARLPASGRVAELSLRALFRGPDLFLHLQEDGARELWGRTGGEVRRIRAELGAWVRSGVARVGDGEIVLDRAALDRLAAGLRLVGADPAEGAEREDAQALLAWVRVAWPDGEEGLLREVSAGEVEDFDGALAALLEAGLVWRLVDGRLGAGAPVQAHPGWSPERVRGAHLALAGVMAEGSEGRLRHLVAARAPAERILGALPEVVRALYLSGREARAIALLDLGLALARQREDRDLEARLLLDRVDLGLGQESVQAANQVLYALGRSDNPAPQLRRAEQLVEGIRLALMGDADRALYHLETLGPLEHDALEIWRQGARTFASSRLGSAQLEALLQEQLKWASTIPERQGPVLGWLANLRYSQGRFVESAELHERAARLKQSARAQASSIINGAAALLEASQFEAANRLGRYGLEVAASCRLAAFEAKAMWVVRSIAYRLGDLSQPRMDLVQAARPLGGAVAGLLASTEAAVAARAGFCDIARALALQAADNFRGHNLMEQCVVMECLALSQGGVLEIAVEELKSRAMSLSIPELGVQSLGLLYFSTEDPLLAEQARNLMKSVEIPDIHQRLDVLSCAEATGLVARPW